jgi:hypothetical protein
MGCLTDTVCPEGHKCVGDDCFPIYATFRDWCSTYDIHIMIPEKDYEVMSYAEYLNIKKEIEDYVKSIPYTPCDLNSQCPEYFESTNNGVCIPIKKTFKNWVLETGIGEYIPVPSSKLITYAEFVETVNSVLKDVGLLNEIKEVYCEQEALLERGRKWQEEFNNKMARY